MIRILKNLREQPPKVHDIKIEIPSPNLHEILVKNNFKPHPRNNGILWQPPVLASVGVTVKALIYPQTIQIDIGCSRRPFIYGIQGVLQLTFLLGQIYQAFSFVTLFEVDIPDFREWVITHYHFGKDGTQNVCGQTNHRTIEDFTSGLISFYMKKMGDKRIARIDQIQRPHTTIDEEIERMLVEEEARQ